MDLSGSGLGGMERSGLESGQVVRICESGNEISIKCLEFLD